MAVVLCLIWCWVVRVCSLVFGFMVGVVACFCLICCCLACDCLGFELVLFSLFGLRCRCVVGGVCCLVGWWFVAFVGGCFLVVRCGLGVYLCGALFVLRWCFGQGLLSGTLVRVGWLAFVGVWWVGCLLSCGLA